MVDCEGSDGWALILFFLGFLAFFSFGAEIDGESGGEDLARSWGEVVTSAGLAAITLRAGLMVDGSKEGSSATQFACQVWKSCWLLSPSWVLVSGVKATDLRLLTVFVSTVEVFEVAILGGVAMAAVPLTIAKASPVVDLDFLDFFVGLSVVATSIAKPLSVVTFLFLTFVTMALLTLFSPSSSLAYFSLRPIFFHAGICSGVDPDMGAIAETTTTTSKQNDSLWLAPLEQGKEGD